MKELALTLALGVAFCASRAYSQAFTTLIEFTGSGGTATGADPTGSLTLSGTRLYGMTSQGGASHDGNIFSVGTDGTNFQNLVSFTGSSGTASGDFPLGSLTVSGAALYGMTRAGGNGNGAYGFGNIFSVGTGGTNYQNLVSFTGSGGTANGEYPGGSLIVGGTLLYGMTLEGGAGFGNIFSVGTGGTNYQNLVSFPISGSAVSDANGSLALGGTTLYGMTANGGNEGYGNIFSVGTDGTNYQNLVSFTGTGGTAGGGYPHGGLTFSGTTLYGMTEGVSGFGNIFSVGTDGTNYQNLLSFTGTGGSADGEDPSGSLILSGTTLYGMTQSGGVDEDGNIFSVGIDGSGYQDLYSFTDGTDGALPRGDLTLSGGTLFGMALYGANGDGTVFALVIPEPGTLALVGAAAVVTVSNRWRRIRSRRKWRRKAAQCAGVPALAGRRAVAAEKGTPGMF
jgi:hypothetical protein